MYDLENERWLLGDMIDHVGIYGSRVAEGLSAFNVGLVMVAIGEYLGTIEKHRHKDLLHKYSLKDYVWSSHPKVSN